LIAAVAGVQASAPASEVGAINVIAALPSLRSSSLAE
jgi:hypothetical protein